MKERESSEHKNTRKHGKNASANTGIELNEQKNEA